MDVWIAVSEENANRMMSALRDFGFDVPDLSPNLFLHKDRIICMGIEPNRIDIHTGISAVEFSQVYPRHMAMGDVDYMLCAFQAMFFRLTRTNRESSLVETSSGSRN